MSFATSQLPSLDSGELSSFDHQPRTRIIFGEGAIQQAGKVVQAWDVKRVLLVTDPGIVAAGHASRLSQILRDAGMEVQMFDQVRENPTTDCVERCLQAAELGRIDGFVGLGGGSSMDTAKGCNFLLSNGGQIKDYWGVGKATKPMLPLLAIPTTAGTGSECQSFALIADEKTHAKMACGDPKAAARAAILDPALTVSQPPRVTACTGVDALTHALETAVTKKRNSLSRMYSHEALKLCGRNLRQVLETPGDLEARGAMLLGAAYAGIAIENSMLGAVHSAANPLTAHFDVVHGHAVGIMLPQVMRFNSQDPVSFASYAELSLSLGVPYFTCGPERAVEIFINRLESLLNAAGIPRSLLEYGIKESDLTMLADEAATQWTAAFNPRTIDKHDFLDLYRSALTPRGEGEKTRLG
jgi:alcohol dehydrogenase